MKLCTTTKRGRGVVAARQISSGDPTSFHSTRIEICMKCYDAIREIGPLRKQGHGDRLPKLKLQATLLLLNPALRSKQPVSFYLNKFWTHPSVFSPSQVMPPRHSFKLSQSIQRQKSFVIVAIITTKNSSPDHHKLESQTIHQRSPPQPPDLVSP